MKKILLLTALAVQCALPVHGQTSAREYIGRVTVLDSLRHADWQLKEFRTAIGLIKEMHALYEGLADSDKKANQSTDAGAVYNLACAYALSDSTDQALRSLAASIEEGFSDYNTMRADDDLAGIRDTKKYQELLSIVRERGDYSLRLQRAAAYNPGEAATKPPFVYQAATDPDLGRLRKRYNLDSVAGTGDEISRVIRLMKWAHRIVRHDGNSSNPPSRNALDIIDVCDREKRGVNCRMMATILNEAYLSMGFPSRHITCLPMDTSDGDCHVITTVYSATKGKWLWMDPTFEAYVMDEKGDLLAIPEVRERLIRGDSVRVCEELNWNGNPYGGGAEGYLKNYMTKNLYWFCCPLASEFGFESKKGPKTYITLYPCSFNPRNRPIGVKAPDGDYYTNDPDYFWQKPSIR